MISYDAAANTARHWDNRGEYGKADAILLLIKANLPKTDSRVLGALAAAEGASLETAEAARRASVNPVSTYRVLVKLEHYGLVTRGASGRWRAVDLPKGRPEVG